MGEIRWYLQWLFLGLFAICLVVLAIRFLTLSQRVPLTAAGTSLSQSASAPPPEVSPPARRSTASAVSNSGNAKVHVPQVDPPGAASKDDEPGTDAQAWRYRKTADKRAVVTQGKLNINSASLEELVALPGIGPKLAQRIIDYRRQHGMFKRVEDLDNVKGIGPSKLAEIKPYVTIKAQGG